MITLHIPLASRVSVTVCDLTQTRHATININNSSEVCHRCRRPRRRARSRGARHPGFQTPSPYSSELSLFSDDSAEGGQPSPRPCAEAHGGSPSPSSARGTPDFLSPLSSRLGAIHGFPTPVASQLTNLTSVAPALPRSSGSSSARSHVPTLPHCSLDTGIVNATTRDTGVHLRPQGFRSRPLPPIPSSSRAFMVPDRRPPQSQAFSSSSLLIQETSVGNVNPPSRSWVQSPPPNRPFRPISMPSVSSTSCNNPSSSTSHWR